MRIKKTLILLSFIFFNLFSFAQDNHTINKHIGADLNFHIGYGYGVSTFIKLNKHNIFLGMGIKSIGRELYGFHIGYSYFFKEREHFSLFLESMLTYTPALGGYTAPVGIFYRPIDYSFFPERRNIWIYYGGIGVGRMVRNLFMIYGASGVIMGGTETRYSNNQLKDKIKVKEGFEFGVVPIPYLKVGIRKNIINSQ